MSALETFEKMLEASKNNGKDNALLRYSLGNEYLKVGRLDDARAHLQAALAFDPRYSAAWKLLGKALSEAGALSEARESKTPCTPRVRPSRKAWSRAAASP